MKGRWLPLLGALVLLAHLALPRPDLRPGAEAFDRYLDGRSFGAHAAQAEPVFHDAATGEPVPATAGAIFAVNDAVRRHFRGTYVGGQDAWTGSLRGEPFAVDAPFLYLPRGPGAGGGRRSPGTPLSSTGRGPAPRPARATGWNFVCSTRRAMSSGVFHTRVITRGRRSECGR